MRGTFLTLRREKRGAPATELGLRWDLLRNKDGATAIVVGLVLTGFVGFLGLGSEAGMWYYTHRNMQSAADSAALSAASALLAGGAANYTTEAKATTAQYGFADGTAKVTVAVNQPPKSGNYTANANAVEVVIAQPQTGLFSSLFMAKGPTISARAVAVQGNPGTGCVLALDTKASAATFGNGTTNVNLVACSLYVNSNSSSALDIVGSATISAYSASIVGNLADSGNASITTTHGLTTGATPITDPYATVPVPPPNGCDHTNFSAKKAGSAMSPGTYCGGITLNANTAATMAPGTYIVDGGSVSIAGGATLSGSGVTIVLTNSSGSNPATMSINGGANVDLSAPTTGSLAGMAIMQDQNGTQGTNNSLAGGTTQNIQGVIYFPKETVKFAGGTQTGSGCTQIVSDEIDFLGNANLETNCTGKGTKTIGSSTSKLVE
jgi:hypothetical protein